MRLLAWIWPVGASTQCSRIQGRPASPGCHARVSDKASKRSWRRVRISSVSYSFHRRLRRRRAATAVPPAIAAIAPKPIHFQRLDRTTRYLTDVSEMTIDEAMQSAHTADVWLFRGGTAADRAIRVLTNAPVNHVAMVVALDDLPPLL